MSPALVDVLASLSAPHGRRLLSFGPGKVRASVFAFSGGKEFRELLYFTRGATLGVSAERYLFVLEGG